jgi:hypothetical protein
MARLTMRFEYLYALCVALGLTWVNFSHFQNTSFFTLALSNALSLLGAAPLFFWLKNEQHEEIPLLPMHGFFYAIAFGVAGFYYPKSNSLNYILLNIIAGLLSLYFAYYLVAPRLLKPIKKVSLFSFYIKDKKAFALFAWIGFPLSCLLYWASRKWSINDLTLSFQIFYHFVFYLLVAAYFQGLLSATVKIVLLTFIFPYQFFIGSGFLEGSIGPLITNLVGICIIYFAIRKRVPWGLITLIILTILLIQPIKRELRDQIWQLNEKGTSTQLKQGTTVVDSFRELSNVMSDKYLTGEIVKSRNLHDDGAYINNSIFQSAIGRLNLLYPTAWIIRETPEPQPYRFGSTYTPLFTKWIPRILWESKPRETLGNDWGRSYQLINNDNFAISFNLPWIAEMYMNFGFFGVLGVSFIIGLVFYVFKATICQAGNDPAKLAFGVLLMTPLMFPESHLSLVLGGVIVGGILLNIFAFLSVRLFPKMFES